MGRYVRVLACDVRERQHEARRYEDVGDKGEELLRA